MDITSYCLFCGYYATLFNTVSLVDFILCCFFVGYHLTWGGLQVSFSWSGTDVFRGWRTRSENIFLHFTNEQRNKGLTDHTTKGHITILHFNSILLSYIYYIYFFHSRPPCCPGRRSCVTKRSLEGQDRLWRSPGRRGCHTSYRRGGSWKD